MLFEMSSSTEALQSMHGLLAMGPAFFADQAVLSYVLDAMAQKGWFWIKGAFKETRFFRKIFSF